MMKDKIEKLLNQLEILPMTNQIWTKFDICLFSNGNTAERQYKDTIKCIYDYVPKGTSGIYMIVRNEKVLYIGESKENIHTRLKRHMDKIYIRTDSRSDFFKLKEHQGHLSIYYWSLPPNLINSRREIEYLLTNALEPEYIKWDIENKMRNVANVIKENDLRK